MHPHVRKHPFPDIFSLTGGSNGAGTTPWQDEQNCGALCIQRIYSAHLAFRMERALILELCGKFYPECGSTIQQNVIPYQKIITNKKGLILCGRIITGGSLVGEGSHTEGGPRQGKWISLWKLFHVKQFLIYITFSTATAQTLVFILALRLSPCLHPVQDFPVLQFAGDEFLPLGKMVLVHFAQLLKVPF